MQTRLSNSTYKLDFQTRHANLTYKLDMKTLLSNSTRKLDFQTRHINSTYKLDMQVTIQALHIAPVTIQARHIAIAKGVEGRTMPAVHCLAALRVPHWAEAAPV